MVKRVISFRFDDDLIRDLRKAARTEGWVFGPFVRELLRRALAARSSQGIQR